MAYKIPFIILFSINFFFSQKTTRLLVQDKLKSYNTTLILATLVSKDYIDAPIADSAKIKNKKYYFSFKVKTSFPLPYQLVLKTSEKNKFNVSDVFYINDKNQEINFDSASGKIIFDKKNLLYMDVNRFNNFFSKFELLKNKLSHEYRIALKNNDVIKQKELIAEKDRINVEEKESLPSYAKKNPKSVVFFWHLVELFEQNGFDTNLELSYNELDREIKNSIYGKKFYKKILLSKKMRVGGNFPNLLIDNNRITSFYGKEYTLIDFWFSRCRPCLQDIPKYKKIYNEFSKKGFEIISISTDRPQDVDNWKIIIKNLGWKQLLDENGKESITLNINKFPTNFLLDSDGKIVLKDINPEELQNFLEKNIKK